MQYQQMHDPMQSQMQSQMQSAMQGGMAGGMAQGMQQMPMDEGPQAKMMRMGNVPRGVPRVRIHFDMFFK